MSNFTDFVGGGGGAGVLPPVVFSESTTWSPAFDMEAVVYVVGGGGSGAASKQTGQSGGGSGVPTAGAAGGVSISYLTLSASTTYTVTVGAKGARVSRTGNYGVTNGNAGGTSSFSGSGITTMTANGGGGGIVYSAGSPLGGTASGGNLENNTGGTSVSTSTTYSGGGACGFGGTGNNGLVTTDSPDAFGSNVQAMGGSLFSSDYYKFDSASGTREAVYFGVGYNPILNVDFNTVGLISQDTNSDRNEIITMVMPTGLAAPIVHYATSGKRISGAFAGGTSASRNGGDHTAAPATIGGGGGAMFLYSGNSTDDTAISGEGGQGIVIVVPVVKLS